VKDASRLEQMAAEDDRLTEVIAREQSRLRHFIRRRVADPRDVEDVLQDVFHKLIEANRLLMPIDHITGWMFQVARNRITDLFRKQQAIPFADRVTSGEDDSLRFEELIPSPDGGPETEYLRQALLDALELAIGELPPEQRDVFVGHELEGRSFKEMAAATGISVNTLLARKRYAVLHLRERLRSIYDDLTNG
jgi:RNA polymerase sigma factor (sigma-70 family)